MNRSQRELIKEAYQEGYYQALYEESIRKSLGKRIGDFIGGKLSRLFRGKADDVVDTVDDIVPTNPIDDLANILRNVEPTGGSTPKLMKQLITIYNDNPGSLKQGQIVVIQAKKSLASDEFGNIVNIIQQPENPNILIGNLADDVIDEVRGEIRRYATNLGDASITLRGIGGEKFIVPDSVIDGIIVVDPMELERLYPGLADRVTDRTKRILDQG